MTERGSPGNQSNVDGLTWGQDQGASVGRLHVNDKVGCVQCPSLPEAEAVTIVIIRGCSACIPTCTRTVFLILLDVAHRNIVHTDAGQAFPVLQILAVSIRPAVSSRSSSPKVAGDQQQVADQCHDVRAETPQGTSRLRRSAP